ncbi:putative prefoldin subunit 6 [Scophthalmus maximus]|uniref:Prefoldin subunit 6 n=1 Tax=Scophthalmus maximus TaxID=52904 RepID=A0A2U9C9Z3_SCOMX|nr:putative prefoldin subunit 6 [Scophthalmus maximus]
MADVIQKKLKAEVEKYTQMQKDVSKSMSARQKLETQLTENNIVKEELDLLISTNIVYKLIGPVLVKQDLDEAKATVAKRLDYINGEIQRYETLLKDLEKKSDHHREILSSLQQEYQKAQGLAGGKRPNRNMVASLGEALIILINPLYYQVFTKQQTVGRHSRQPASMRQWTADTTDIPSVKAWEMKLEGRRPQNMKEGWTSG